MSSFGGDTVKLLSFVEVDTSYINLQNQIQSSSYRSILVSLAHKNLILTVIELLHNR